jgi:hypothetical protein
MRDATTPVHATAPSAPAASATGAAAERGHARRVGKGAPVESACHERTGAHPWPRAGEAHLDAQHVPARGCADVAAAAAAHCKPHATAAMEHEAPEADAHRSEGWRSLVSTRSRAHKGGGADQGAPCHAAAAVPCPSAVGRRTPQAHAHYPQHVALDRDPGARTLSPLHSFACIAALCSTMATAGGGSAARISCSQLDAGCRADLAPTGATACTDTLAAPDIVGYVRARHEAVAAWCALAPGADSAPGRQRLQVAPTVLLPELAPLVFCWKLPCGALQCVAACPGSAQQSAAPGIAHD